MYRIDWRIYAARKGIEWSVWMPRRCEDDSFGCWVTPRPAGIWDLAIALGGLVYLGIVLFTDWTSPLFGMTLIVPAGYQLFAHHSRERQGRD
jgi:hypothetical protein